MAGKDIKVQRGKSTLNPVLLKQAYKLMKTAERMARLYDEQREICAKYVHSTSRGHEAIQLAVGLQLKAYDYASLYYRDESILLALGLQPYELMLQLMAKADDPFTGGQKLLRASCVKTRRLSDYSTSKFGYRYASYSGNGYGACYFISAIN